jgi:hypothetical protein
VRIDSLQPACQKSTHLGKIPKPVEFKAVIPSTTSWYVRLWRAALLQQQALAAVLCCGSLAGVLDFTALYRHLNSDALIPVFISLWRWRPYYWAQERYGMFLALLAAPFKNPLSNLLVMEGLNIFCALLSFFLVARYLLGSGWRWVFTGLVAVTAFMGLTSPLYNVETLSSVQFTASAVTFGMTGLLLARAAYGPHRTRRLRAAFGFVCVACWINFSAPVLLGAVVATQPRFWRELFVAKQRLAGRWTLRQIWAAASEMGAAREAIVLGLSGLVGVAASRSMGERRFRSHILPLGTWPHNCLTLWRNTFIALKGEAQGPPPLLLYLVGCVVFVGLAALSNHRVRAALSEAGPRLASGALGAGLYAILVGTQSFGRANLWSCRYWIPVVTYLTVFASAAVIVALAAVSRPKLAAMGLPLAMLLATATAIKTHGKPSYAIMRQAIDDTFGERTADILKSGCTHVAGHYWRVWPSVFHANMVLHERGESRRIWGLTFRSMPTKRFWNAEPPSSWRVAVPPQDLSPDLLARFGAPNLVVEQQLPTIQVVRVVP